ncbi:MAG: oligosaccharide flippase family protein [Solirubrobacterales bacterium]|nr:oligosaccharide flippase family protein [Solirubrobacterales bacterium]
MLSLFDRLRHAARRPSDNLLARGVTLSVIGRGGSLFLGFVGSVALARFLGPSDRGLLGLMTSASAVALALTALGVPQAVVYFSSRREADQGALLGNSFAQATLLTAVIVPLALVFHQALADALGHGQGGRTWALVAVLVSITFLDWTTHGQLQGMLMFGRFSALLIIGKALSVVAILALVGAAGLGVAGGVIATAVASIVMIFGSLPPILARARPRLNLKLWDRMVRYGFRVQIGSMLQLANFRLDVIIVQLFRPLSQVGYYVIAQTIAELVVNLAVAFQGSIMPLVAHYEGDEKARTNTILSVRHHGILAAVAVIGNAILGPLVIALAYGSKFTPAIAPMLILLPGIWFLGMGVVIQGDLSGRGRPGLSSALAGLAAIVTVALDFALIPPLGVIGAALASVAAYSTFGIASLEALHRVTGISIRELIVPTRADFDAYRSVIARGFAALKRSARRPTPPQAGDHLT